MVLVELLNGSQGEYPKIYNILKTAHRRAKPMKIGKFLHMYGILYIRFPEFSLGSFGARLKFPMLKFLKSHCCHSFYLIATKLYDKYATHRRI